MQKPKFSHFIGDNATPEQKQVARYLMDAVRKHSKSPDYANSSALNRSILPAAELTDTDLRQAGFVPSIVAVPEYGQSRITTYRHPANGLHFHKHKNDWLFHIDNWPSLSLVMRNYKAEHPEASTKDALKYLFRQALPESSGHIVNEGLPGWMAWLNGRIRGRGGFIKHENPSMQRQLGGVLTASALLTAAQYAASDFRTFEPVQNAAAVTGFTVGSDIAAKVHSELASRFDAFKHPSYMATLALAGIPIVSALGTRYAASKLMKYIKAKGKRRESRRQTPASS